MLCKLVVAFAIIGLVRGRAHVPSSPWDGGLGAFRRDCIRNNADLAAVESALAKSIECIKTEVGEEGMILVTRARIFMDEETIVAAAKHICAKKDIIIGVCAFDWIDSTVPCVDPELRHRVNDSKIAMQEFANYICKDDAQIVRTMSSEKELKCLETDNISNKLMLCAAEDVGTFDSLSRTDQCIAFHKLKDCSIGTLRSCPTYGDFLERFFTIIAIGSPCENRPAAMTANKHVGFGGAQDRVIAAMSAELQKACTKYNVDLAEIQAASTRTVECFEAAIDDEAQALIMTARILQDEDSVVSAARNLCAKKEKLSVCVFNLLDFMVPCTDPELRGRVNDSKVAMQDFTNYICENDAEVISKLFGKEELMCLESNKVNQLSQCVARVDSIDMDSLSNTERCVEFYKLKDCGMETLSRCSTNTYVDLLERFVTSVAVGTHCENRPNTISNDINNSLTQEIM